MKRSILAFFILLIILFTLSACSQQRFEESNDEDQTILQSDSDVEESPKNNTPNLESPLPPSPEVSPEPSVEPIEQEHGKYTGNLMDHEGDETLFLYEQDLYYAIRILDGKTDEILFDKPISYLYVEDIQITDVNADDKDEIYLLGSGDGTKLEEILEIKDNDLVKIYGDENNNQYRNQIETKIEKTKFSFNLEDLSLNGVSTLPDKVFYALANGENPETYLHTTSDWKPVFIDGEWLIDATMDIQIKAGEYYWGPPTLEIPPEDYEDFYIDIARVHYWLKNNGQEWETVDKSLIMKYSDEGNLNPPLLESHEAALGILVLTEITIPEAVEALGGNVEDYDEDALCYGGMTIDGVILGGFVDSTLIYMNTTSDKYPTSRGLTVGDSKKTVQMLYGSPDFGFFEDELVGYYFSFTDANGSEMSYYRKMYITFVDDKVSSIEFDQMASD